MQMFLRPAFEFALSRTCFIIPLRDELNRIKGTNGSTSGVDGNSFQRRKIRNKIESHDLND